MTDNRLAFLNGGGELARLIAEFDWTATPLGPIADWPQSLKSAMSFILRSPVPIVTLWGEVGIMLYNDGYADFAGRRHPALLGSEVRKGWPEVADFNDNIIKTCLLRGETISLREQELVLDRSGTFEQGWMDLDYSPLLDEAGEPAGVMAIVVEVTDRVRAQDRLAGESERLRQMFLSAPVFMATLTGPDHVFEGANDAYLQVIGHRDVIGRSVREALPELASQGFYELLERVYSTGEAYTGLQQPVLLQRTRDGQGELAYLDFAYQPLRDADGHVTGIFVSGYEVTELRETQDRLRIAQQAGRIGTFELFPENGTMAVSEEFCRVFGIPFQAEFKIEQMLERLVVDDRDRVRTTQRTLESSALDYIEYRIRRGDDGSERWIARRGEALPDPVTGRLRFMGVVYDITDRKVAEDRLKQLNETLEQRVEERTADRDRMWRLSRDVMVVGELNGRILAVNPAWEELLGLTEEELIGTNIIDYVHEEDRERAADELANLERGMPTLRFESRLRHKSGSYRWLSWTAVPDERFLHAVGRDIHSEMEARAQLETAHEALRQSQKMEAVGQLTGGIAHDFNNLLTIVTGNIDMAGRALNSAGVTDVRSRRALDNALKGAERAAALTQRLLAFSRRQPLAPKALDLDRLVLGMSDLINRALGETIRLEIVTAPGLWRVEADPNQLESAILNLAVNARDAMPDGGQLTIETANARLDHDYTAAHAEVAPGQYVVIAVTDTGIGMSRDTIERVFEPFFTTKEVGRGTGLGLSMIYGFVKQSGGHVKVYSEEGQGTTVKIYLPRMLAEPGTEEEPELRQGLEFSLRRETVLAVEDDDDVRAYTVECLRELGYQVLEAHDGPAALRLLERRAHPVDLLFTDVVMPGMSGRELAEAARTILPGLKVLYTSGYTRNAIVHGGRLDPGVEMIAKPFSYAALAQKIRDVLDAGRTGRVLAVVADNANRGMALSALRGAGFSVDEAADGSEALGMVRSSEGRYDALVIDSALPDRSPMALFAELRALHAHLPILILTEPDDTSLLGARVAGDPCAAVAAKPYTIESIAVAIGDLARTCAKEDG